MSDLQNIKENLSFPLSSNMALTTETAINHGKRVAIYCYKIAVQLGLNDKTARHLKETAVYHDIGNVLIPIHILTKPEALTPEEYEIIKTHAYNGYAILKNAQDKAMQFSAQLALKHHENLDGSGYPHGLRANDLGIEDRILRVADTFDALISWRPHRPAIKLKEAFEILEKESHKHFDAKIVRALKTIMTREVPLNSYNEATSQTQVAFVDDLIQKVKQTIDSQ